ncbi:MAG TPA: SEC-C metal-binding domain-containing protein, partial [Vicinamibacteria bacterium]|nr:SEC-C metal-binding domain-containing protein [Vicinamibacteria bacterium]
QVLNAKYHEKEAEIVAQAGRMGAVTIATNMAGRGTDILLGGNPEFLAREMLRKRGQDPMTASDVDRARAQEEARRITDKEHQHVVELGGLHILATERHEARRIDNQLRGRAGRQGDPGSSRFYLSLEDDLMRIFGSDRISGLMLRLGMEEGVPIEHGMVTKSIERAQRQVEAQNFAVRKHLLEYDDVMNKQRKAVYDMRRMVLEGKESREHVERLKAEVVEWYLDNYASDKEDVNAWNLEGLQGALKETFGLEVPLSDLKRMGKGEMTETFGRLLSERYADKERAIGPELMQFHQRMIMLQIVDAQWKDHLYSLDHLKEGIGLRGYGQRDPLVEYKKESYSMFQALMDRIDEEVLRWIFLYQPVPGRDAGEGSEGGGGGGGVLPARGGSRGPRGGAAPPLAAREPEAPLPRAAAGGLGGLGLGSARPLPRNLTFNDPTEVPSAFAKAEPKEAKGGSDEVQTIKREGKKVGRNDPCPCGSGKKYKKCHGTN